MGKKKAGTKMSTTKTIETALKAVAALLAAAMAIIKFLGYIEKLKPESVAAIMI